MRIVNVVGARPNLMKIAPIIEQLGQYPQITQILLHTGQHYDYTMSKIFFEQLGLPEPDIYLGVGSASHAQQTARIMVGFEQVLAEYRPDLVLVVGDVNSTLACAITAVKLRVPLAHVEAGLRSFDRRMPEEINRIVTDALSDYLFTPCADANQNLQREGVPEEKVFFVGNVMIDTLLKYEDKVLRLDMFKQHGLRAKGYAVLTLHRPSNVDERGVLRGILEALAVLQEHIKIIFPVHPRTVKMLKEFELWEMVMSLCDLLLIEPLGYLEFLNLVANARFVLTDSGGVQEETTFLGIPCLTLRENTEWLVTVREGTNKVVGSEKDVIVAESRRLLNAGEEKGKPPDLWDGQASVRIARVIAGKPCRAG